MVIIRLRVLHNVLKGEVINLSSYKRCQKFSIIHHHQLPPLLSHKTTTKH
ncbi:unnamed protein product [Arabidopsis lyrata]|uniref:Predicted protein n=1 Tax=Arabidopsis lyrata subsp. lyrata TaxID=81972 RepID=D7LPL5_ARALL|nr:predicted protein [Arabidopsis lyrata subsp. lyrata]CAH8266991.1 unnamed protein product [Arabidopsis lyrata]